MCKILVQNFAEYEGEMFGRFPTPLEMVTAMETEEIVNLFKMTSTYWEGPVLSLIQNDTCNELVSVAETLLDDKMDDSGSNNSEDFIYKRSANKDCVFHGWCTEIPEDMHAKDTCVKLLLKHMAVVASTKLFLMS